MTSRSPDGTGEMTKATSTGFGNLPAPGAHRHRDFSSDTRFAGATTWATRVLVLALLSLMPFRAEAQNPSPPPATPDQQSLGSKQLDALIAPVALYPDTLLAQMLMASTYPLEVVQADRWLIEHKDMEGDRLKQEAEKQGWDDSVKSLIATPSVLSMMSSKLDWTQKLGDAVLAQQPDVMDAIQRLRSKAYATNKLKSTTEQNVTVSQEENKQVIAIAPTNPDIIYVPNYDPAVVYGEWPYPDYPPYYFPEPSYIASGILATGIAFGTAYALGRWASGARFWGGGLNWRGGQIDVNRGARVTHWRHNPQHRRGVAYNNVNVRQRFGGTTIRAGTRGQLDFRGRSGQQVLNPGGGRADLREQRPANRPDIGNRPNTANRPNIANRPNAGDRGRARQASHAVRPSSRPSHPSRGPAVGNVQQRRVAQRPAHRERASVGAARPAAFGYAGRRGGGGRAFAGGGRGFGGGGRGGGRGGRRSDVRLKHDVVLLGRLDNGLGFYRFAYNGSNRVYVGVLAQEVQTVAPQAVVRGRDGYLKVLYDKLSLKFQTYDQWIASGAQVPRRGDVKSTEQPSVAHPRQ
jgi:Protein of unknown function (DUF3300)